MNVTIDLKKAETFLIEEDFKDCREKAGKALRRLLTMEDHDQVLGWISPCVSEGELEAIKAKAEEIKREADLFVLVGVGGSNQAARAMIDALADGKGPEVLYMGNTLSSHSVSKMLKRLEGRNIYINVIAKNFETLEPGSHFRILRQWMKKRYDREEMAKRIIVTGTKGSRLEEIAKENSYLFLSFPSSVGGRYSAFSPVCLFPIGAAGLDLDKYLAGMERAAEDCRANPSSNPAAIYGAVRNLLYEKGYDIEMLVSFEPKYSYLTKWWVQLFGESEGKEKKGIFPSSAIYSEDLHSMGQYMQEGRRSLIETFVSAEDPGAKAVIEPDPEFGDGFDYLDGMDFDQMNKAAEEATLNAHWRGGVPCIRFLTKDISEETFGELFYYFMMACAVSGIMRNINPFDQEGVEEYKRSMFAALGKKV
ncbi:glucose-6-phosphate isomerase [Lacrimispora brassicae]